MRTLSETLSYIRRIRERPGMFIGPPYYMNLASFLDGCDYVLEGSLLSGLKEKLKAVDAPQNLAWQMAFLHMIDLGTTDWVNEDFLRSNTEVDDRACKILAQAVIDNCVSEPTE